MFVQTNPTLHPPPPRNELLKRLSPNLVWWLLLTGCLGDICCWLCLVFHERKVWFAAFKVKITMKAHMMEIWLSITPSELLILLQPNFGGTTVNYYIPTVILRSITRHTWGGGRRYFAAQGDKSCFCHLQPQSDQWSVIRRVIWLIVFCSCFSRNVLSLKV